MEREKDNENFEYKEEKIKKPQNYLVEDGISNIFVHGNLLIVKDIQQNIHFFDLIDGETTERTNVKSQSWFLYPKITFNKCCIINKIPSILTKINTLLGYSIHTPFSICL